MIIVTWLKNVEDSKSARDRFRTALIKEGALSHYNVASSILLERFSGAIHLLLFWGIYRSNGIDYREMAICGIHEGQYEQ